MPHCSAQLWFIIDDETTHYIPRGDMKAIEQLAPGLDLLDVVEIVMELEEKY